MRWKLYRYLVYLLAALHGQLVMTFSTLFIPKLVQEYRMVAASKDAFP